MSTRDGLRRTLPWVLCAVAVVLIAVSGWLLQQVGGAPLGEPWGWLEAVLVRLATAGVPVVGAVIASRLPDNPYGWLWLGIGLLLGVIGIAQPLAVLVDSPLWVAATAEAYSFALLMPLIVLAVLLFPTGRLPGPKWRWLGRAAVVASVLLMLAAPLVPVPRDPAAEGPLVLRESAGELLLHVVEAVFWAMAALVLPAVGALLLRYHQAGPVERRQLTWFLYAALVAVALLVLNVAGLLPWRLVSVLLLAVSLALFPVAVLVAVLRYRLYEIDRIVSRTVTYGLLTATLVAVYVLVVAVLSHLGLPEGSSDVVVAAVTLTVAGVAGRVRRRLQAVVDRRFDRARYDAGRAVDAFAARLREQVDLDEVTTGLRDTVAATVTPTRVAVWLRLPTHPAGPRP